MTDAPSAVFRYTLTWQDMLAYEQLPKTMPGLQRVTLYIWLGLAGFMLELLPPDLVGEFNTPRFWVAGALLVAVQYGIFWGLRALTRVNRARYRYPRAVDVVVEQWPDRLIVENPGKTMTVAFEDIGALLPTPARLFIAAGRELVIMPAGTFGDAGGMQQLVDSIDAYMRQQYAARAALPDA